MCQIHCRVVCLTALRLAHWVGVDGRFLHVFVEFSFGTHKFGVVVKFSRSGELHLGLMGSHRRHSAIFVKRPIVVDIFDVILAFIVFVSFWGNVDEPFLRLGLHGVIVPVVLLLL